MVKLTTNDLFDQMWRRSSPYTIGFDNIFEDLKFVSNNQQPSYPPYNIVKKSDELFLIEIAVAGFGEDDLDIEVQENELWVTGEILDEEESDENIHKGIANRKFRRIFKLAEDLVVNSPSLKNGMLSIPCERIIPEEKKARKLEIVDTAEFLSE